jgi:hypothetical protein
MSGIDFVFNIALGNVKNLASLPAANDALVVVLLQSTGLQGDDTLRDYDDLAALLAATNDEATFTNYARITRTSGIVPTVDDVNNRLDIDITTDFTWTSAGGATNNTLAKLLICYDNDTTAGTDANIIPLTAHSYDETTSGSDITAVVAASGFYRAQG